MSEEKRKHRPWLTVLVALTFAFVATQAAHLFYVQQRVMTALNGVYGELSESPELNALLDLNAALPDSQVPVGEAGASVTQPNLDESIKNLEGLLGPGSSGTVQQLLDMTKQLAKSYDDASGVTSPAPERSVESPKPAALRLPRVALAETADTYSVEVDFGSVDIAHLTAEVKNQTVHLNGAASEHLRQPDASQPFDWSVALNDPIDLDSLTLASEGNVYTLIVKKRTTVA
ncbi:MAG: hypothetical protein KJ060_10180 [Candidatus Hydrogenedentes bacterium]|nr:hypothetical protein [Candidatus Hydrogenedentota bacterium]